MVTLFLLALSSAALGAFAFTGTLWVTGFGSMSRETGNRLDRIKGGHDVQENGSPADSIGAHLRRRASVNFGGITLVSGKVAAEWATTLERAGLTLTVKEYLILRGVAAVGVGLAGMLVSPIPLLGLIGAPVAFFGVGFWVKRRISSRKARLEEQLVEMLQMISSGLRAGFGLMQALEAASGQLPAPLSVELRRTLRDTAVGASVEQALAGLNNRVNSPDFDIAITAILIQRSVGGNLAEILENLAHTMRERERIRGEIRTLTSQQRLTGYVIAGIPVGLGAFFFVTSPEYVSLLITDSLGRMMLLGAGVLELIGFLVIQKIVNIEV